MNWAVWLILLIPVAVSILSLLFRPTKEEPRRPNVPGRGPGPRPARRSVSDIDQFLEEINRRRREAAERRRAPEPVAVPIPPVEQRPVPPPPRPVPPPVARPARRPERERALPPRVRPRVPEPERVIVAEEVVVAVPVEKPAEAAGARITFPIKRPRPTSRALEQIFPLLRDPQGLRSAIVLREILDGPVCRRRNGPRDQA